jgi:hypothetical protein
MHSRACRIVKIVLSVVLLIAGLAACTSSGPPRRHESTAASSVRARRSMSATSTFAGLVLRHPRSWTERRPIPIDALDPRTEGYLTNEPIIAGCATAHPRPAKVQDCGIPVAAMTPGGVFVRVSVLYQQPEDPLTASPNRRLAGFPASVVTGGQPGMVGCPPATRSVISTTIAPRHREPTAVDISACLGGRSTALAREQVRLMLDTATLTTRPPDTTPVRGATPCTGRQLSVGFGPQAGGVSQTEAILYAVRNISSHTCSIGGYPAVQLESRAGPVRAVYRDGGGQYANYPGDPRRPSYLRPGGYASFLIAHGRCQTSAGVHASRARITLPTAPAVTRVTLAVNDRSGGSGLFVCGDESKIINISAIHGF